MDDSPPLEAPLRVLLEVGASLPTYIAELQHSRYPTPAIQRSINQLFGLLYQDWDWDTIEGWAYRLNDDVGDPNLNGYELYIDFASDLLGAIQDQRLYNLFHRFDYGIEALLPERGCLLLKYDYC